MLRKSLKLFPVLIVVMITGLLVSGCGKQGSRFANNAPTISITSYEGYDPDNPYTDSTAVTLFQQRVFWHAEDRDGIITGYAYRILDDAGNPISTAGNAYIDSLGEVTPDNVLSRFGSGWVLHYKQGADQTFPLNDSRAMRTIWSSKKYATINFRAANAAGDSVTSIGSFEVICIDNRGEICAQSALRRFISYSRVPTCFLSTTKGDPNGDQVGTGIRLSFTLDDDDPFIQATAWYYIFNLQKVNKTTNAVIPDSTSDQWFSTINQHKINEYLLTKYTNPKLSSDYNDAGAQVTYTRVVAKVIDIAGIVSEPDTITFAVREGFHPESLIYHQRVFALGNNHYIDYSDATTPEVLPYTIVNDKQIFATPFFRDVDGYYTAVSSSNLKVWLRWGWHAEYGIQTASGATIITDNPYDKKIDELRDEDTDINYYSEVTAFDLRLDGEPYNYPPLFDAEHLITDPGTGKKWLRVPVNSSLGQTIVLANLEVNTPDFPYHHFEVRAVDLQDEIDPTPAEIMFKILPPVEKAEKNGILIIDDDPPNNNFAPEDSIDAKYANMLSSYSGEVVLRKRYLLEYQDIRNRKIALSDIQKYKLIIYHADYPNNTPNFSIDHDAYALYLNQGGNMLISAGGNLHGQIQAVTLAAQRLFETYFGVIYSLDATSSVTGNMLGSTWFVKAKAKVAPFSDMSLAFDISPSNPQPQDVYVEGDLLISDPNESFLNLINTRKGLGPVTYFNSLDSSYNSGVSALYEYISKPVYVQSPTTPPASNYYCPQTQTEYNSVQGKTVALRKVTLRNKCYMTGFPLSYMTKASSKQFMSQVLADIMAR